MELTELIVRAIVLLDVMLFQVFDSVLVVHAHEGLGWRLEIGIELVNHGAGGGLHQTVNYINQKILQSVKQLFKGNKGTLGLDVSIL